MPAGDLDGLPGTDLLAYEIREQLLPSSYVYELHVDGIRGADFVGFEDNEPFLHGLNRKGLQLSDSNFPVRSGSHLVIWELVKQGNGVGVMTTRVGDAVGLGDDQQPVDEVWLESRLGGAGDDLQRLVGGREGVLALEGDWLY